MDERSIADQGCGCQRESRGDPGMGRGQRTSVGVEHRRIEPIDNTAQPQDCHSVGPPEMPGTGRPGAMNPLAPKCPDRDTHPVSSV
jgi:hypothetical protein